MTIEELKKMVPSLGLSEGVQKEIERILSLENVSQEDLKKILSLIDNELKIKDQTTKAYEDVAIALDTMAHEIDTAADIAEENLKNLENN